MKLTEFKNGDAIDLLADILDPLSSILGDATIQNAVKAKRPKIEIVKIAMKNHKDQIVEILARCNNVEVKDYSCNIITITKDLLELLNDQELVDFFQSQQQMMASESSTSAMENIEEKEQ